MLNVTQARYITLHALIKAATDELDQMQMPMLAIEDIDKESSDSISEFIKSTAEEGERVIESIHLEEDVKEDLIELGYALKHSSYYIEPGYYKIIW